MGSLRAWLGLCDHQWSKWVYAKVRTCYGDEYENRTRTCDNCGLQDRRLV